MKFIGDADLPKHVSEDRNTNQRHVQIKRVSHASTSMLSKVFIICDILAFWSIILWIGISLSSNVG